MEDEVIVSGVAVVAVLTEGAGRHVELHVPPPLLDQLAVGGRLVIPVGPVGDYQELWRITRRSPDQVESVSLGGVRFVPLLRTEEVRE